DLVVIRKQSDANDGDIIVALVEEEATLKRLYRDEENGRIILHPENKDMSDIVVDNCIIQGIAVKVIKDLN
ncbi:MAG: LexA family protein, partial [Anaerovoracaceae bacterium]